MKRLLRCLPEVEERVRASQGCVLMLDFDGTLSPLSDTPRKAIFPSDKKAILEQVSRYVPTAIISGRSLTDIQRKVGIRDVVYVGNHGMEWKIENKTRKIQVPGKMMRALSSTRHQLGLLAAVYPGSLLEDKGLTLALHYRLVEPHSAVKLVSEAKKKTALYIEKELLAVRISNKTFELWPALNWNKGKIAELLCRDYFKGYLPIYIGDDITDEDAFRALYHGITVRIGRSSRSVANYYLENERQVGPFLKWLCSVIPAPLA